MSGRHRSPGWAPALILLFVMSAGTVRCSFVGEDAVGMPSDSGLGSLEGVWVRSIRDGVEGREGLCLGPDGKLGLLGIHSMHGLTWSLDDHTLSLATNTERYPEPQEQTFEVEALESDRLSLRAEAGYLAGTYERDDSAAGWVTGTVLYQERIALPPDAVVVVNLEDVSLQDVPAVGLAFQTVPTQGRQVPIPFHLCYDTDQIDPRHTYAVRATISASGRLLFVTSTAHHVLTHDAPSTIDVVVTSARR